RVIMVAKNPHYWDAATVRLRAIHFHPSTSVEAEERAFRAGQLHLTEALPVSKVDTWRRDRPEVLRIDPFLDTYFYRLNVTRPILNEVKVRRALSLALDRASIVANVTRGGQQPAFSFTPPGTAGYEPPAEVSSDPAAARALLAEAGYPGGQGLPQLELLINSSRTRGECAAGQHGDEVAPRGPPRPRLPDPALGLGRRLSRPRDFPRGLRRRLRQQPHRVEQRRL
ncbi:MAG: ABC transporter substrate-binding protein, partial [Cephaloticoccus sp.]